MKILKTTGSVILVFIVATIVGFLFFFVTPTGSPSLNITMDSSRGGFSQMFFAEGEEGFSETRSTWSTIPQGSSLASFPLSQTRGTIGDTLRWDPLDQPAEITVREIELSGFLTQTNVSLDLLVPSIDISSIEQTDAGAIFTANSNDSQILISLDTASFYQSVRIKAIGASLIFGILVSFVFILFRRQKRGRFSDLNEEGLNSTISVGSKTASPHIPIWMVGFSLITITIGLFMLFRGSQVIGVSWDEPIREDALAEFFRSGWLVPQAYFGEGIPDPVLAAVYGPIALLLGHFGAVALVAHEPFVSSLDAVSFQARHLVVAGISLIAVVSLFVIARTLFRSWRWAILAAAFSLSLPLWLGHSMFNIKDVPTASGFTLWTLALVILSTQVLTRHNRILILVALIGGSLLAVGSRPGIWVALAASAAGTFLLLFLLEGRVHSFAKALKTFVLRTAFALLGFGISLATLWVIYPAVFSHPLSVLRTSISGSQGFPAGGTTLSAGIEMSSQPPFSYIPLWLGAQLPVILLVTALIGIVGVIWTFAKSVSTGVRANLVVVGGIPVLLQATVVPVASILLGSTLYGGLRQLLFIFPAISLLSVVGFYFLVSIFGRSSVRWLQPAAWGVLALSLLLPLIAQIRLFPFNFAFFNPIAASQPIDQNWDVDGWWLSGRELVENRVFPERTFCLESAARPLADCDKIPVIEPYLVTSPDSDIALQEDEYVVLNRFPESFTASTCETLFSVTRGLWWQEVDFSAAEICKAELAPYPSGGIDFSGITSEDEYLLWGWNPYLLWGWGAMDPRGVELQGSTGSLGFILDQSEQTTNLKVVGFSPSIDGNSYSLRAFVNGTDLGSFSLDPNQESQTLDFAIPQSAWAASEDARTIVRFEIEGDSLQAEGADPSELRVFTLERLALN